MFKNKITFAITTHINNDTREKYLHECINSIINQTDYNWEILIFDDNSPRKINFSKYKNFKNINIFKNEKNIGMFKGWNFLLNKCNTEFFIPMGDDDIVNKNLVTKCLEVKQKNNLIECIYFDSTNINHNGEYLNYLSTNMSGGFHSKGKNLLNYRVKNSLNFQYTYFVSAINTEILKNLGGFIDFGTITDTYISYLISENFNVYYLKESLIKIRKHQNNASNNIKRIYDEQYVLIPFLLKKFDKNLNNESKKYLLNLKKTIKIRYYKNLIKTKLIKNTNIILKKIGLYSILSKFWRKYILK